MKNWKLIGVMAAVAVVAAAIPAEAGCPNARTFSSGYIYTPGGPAEGVTPAVKGSFWTIGAGDPALAAGTDNGTWQPRQASASYGPGYYYGEDAGWLYIYPGYPANMLDGVSGNWGNISAVAESDGCPDTATPAGPLCMAVVLTDQAPGSAGECGYFLLATDQADVNGNYIFNGDTLPGDNMTLAEIPAPRIVGSGNTSDSSVTLNIAAPQISEGLYLDPSCNDALMSYRIVAQVLPDGSTPPSGRDVAEWGVDLSGAVDLSTGVDVVANCSGNQDIYLATVVEFDSNFETLQVSCNSTRVECGTNFTDIDQRPRVRPDELQIRSRGGKNRGR